jgi:hypothetical protein
MTQSPEHLDTDFDRERDADRYQIVYLIKRPGYEFVLSVPTAPTADLSGAEALFQLRFRQLHQQREVVLDLKALEDFYDSLSRLMEYLSIERQKYPRL